MDIPLQEKSALKQIVRDFLAGRIFFSSQVRDQSILSMVFMPLAFGALAFPEEPPAKPEEPKAPEKFGHKRPKRPDPDLKDVLPGLNAKVESAKETVGDVEYRLRWNNATQEELDNANRALTDAEGELSEAYELANQVADDKHRKALDEYQEKLSAHRKTVATWRRTHKAWAAVIASMSDEIKAWEDRRDAYFKKMGEELGVLYAYMDKAGPRAINGYPMFFEFAMLHKSDWDIVRESITREQQRDIEL